MKFSEEVRLNTRSNWEHFQDVTVNPLNPGSIYLFPGSVFACNIMEKGVNGISWNFYETLGTTQEIISLTVSNLPRLLQGLRSRPLNMFVSNTMVKSIGGFSWNFQDILAMPQEAIWNILGMIGLTPWTQGSFFYFLSPCWLATSRNTGWMDIHEVFRIWTQEAIAYTVWRLSRLFHALQTRRGGDCALGVLLVCFILFFIFFLNSFSLIQEVYDFIGLVFALTNWNELLSM